MSSVTRALQPRVFLAPNNTFSADGRIVVGALLSDTASAELYVCTQITPSVAWQLLTGGTGAPAGSPYITAASDGTLSAERVLTAGANITLTDNGPNSTLVIAASGGGGVGAAGYQRLFALMGS